MIKKVNQSYNAKHVIIYTTILNLSRDKSPSKGLVHPEKYMLTKNNFNEVD